MWLLDRTRDDETGKRLPVVRSIVRPCTKGCSNPMMQSAMTHTHSHTSVLKSDFKIYIFPDDVHFFFFFKQTCLMSYFPPFNLILMRLVCSLSLDIGRKVGTIVRSELYYRHGYFFFFLNTFLVNYIFSMMLRLF